MLLGYFENKESEEYKTFASVANKLRDSYVFGATFAPEAVAKYSVNAPALLLFKAFDEKLDTFAGSFTESEITSFISDNSIPSMDEIGPDNYEIYMNKGLPILYLFVSDDDEKKKVGPQVEPLAKDYKGKISFVYIDAGACFCYCLIYSQIRWSR